MIWLQTVLAAAIGAFSAILVNRDVAVFNDGFRPVYGEYFRGDMTRQELGATGFAVSIGVLCGYGVTTSIACGILLFHVYLLASDMIGSWCPRTNKGMILAGALGAAWSVFAFLGMNQINAILTALPVDVMTPLGSLADYVIATFPFFPAIAAGYQFGVKKGLFTGAFIAAAYIFISKWGTFSAFGTSITLNSGGMAMMVGMIVLIVLALKVKDDSESTGLDASLFAENTQRIRKNTIFVALTGGVLAMGVAMGIVTVGMTAGTLVGQGDWFGAAVFTVAGAIGYVPLVYTTAITSGVFTTGSRFVMAAGFFTAVLGLSVPATLVVAFIAGALVEIIEASIIGGVGNKMNQYAGLRVMGNHIRKSMSELLEYSLFVGSVVCGAQLTDAIGYGFLGALVVIGGWLFNRQAKKKLVMQMVVAPLIVIILAVVVNLLYFIGLANL